MIKIYEIMVKEKKRKILWKMYTKQEKRKKMSVLCEKLLNGKNERK